MAALGRWGVLLAFGATILIFSLIKPEQFLKLANFEVILSQAAPLAIIASALTVVLVMNDFDLSFAAVAGLASAVAVILMSFHGIPWWLAILAGLATGAAVGVINGGLVAFVGTQSFVATLAMATAVTGVEFLVAEKVTIFSGISPAYVSIGQGTVFGLDAPVVIALGVLIIGYLLLEQSEFGRRMYAIGASSGAARLAGISVRRVRFTGFVLVGVAAATAGVVASAQIATYAPGSFTGFLLPAYAAVFLGSAVFRERSFTIAGTLIGILFLGVLQNGLILVGLSDAWVNLVNGGILIFSITLARIGVSRA